MAPSTQLAPLAAQGQLHRRVCKAERDLENLGNVPPYCRRTAAQMLPAGQGMLGVDAVDAQLGLRRLVIGSERTFTITDRHKRPHRCELTCTIIVRFGKGKTRKELSFGMISWHPPTCDAPQ